MSEFGLAHCEIWADIDPEKVPFDDLMAADRPILLKNLAAAWPIVRADDEGHSAVMAHLRAHYDKKPVVAYTGAPEMAGKFFYNEDMSGFNFATSRVDLSEYLGKIEKAIAAGDDTAFYVGSTDVETYLPTFRDLNDLALNHPMFAENPYLASLWIGTRTTATCHFDYSNNIACCLAGLRRFTLFPPDQIGNLYPGPLEPTPGGQVVSLVDFEKPDFDAHPKFSEALKHGVVADMAPGDVLFYPAMWWHHVESKAPFNVMMNYWWNTSPSFIDTPMTTLLHGLLSLRDRPDHEKRAWKSLFDYYIFADGIVSRDHIPESAQGALAPMDTMIARRLRAQIIHKLNR